MSKLTSIIDSLIGHVIYVWSSDGENVCLQRVNGKIDPEAWITDKETSAANAKRAIKLYNTLRSAGVFPIFAMDCSAFVCYVLKSLGIIRQTSDYNTRGLYTLCGSHPTRDKLVRGDLVFHSKDGTVAGIHHVGIYLGGDKVSESRGRDDGGVITDFDDHPRDWSDSWNMFGRIDKLTAAGEEPEPPKVPFRFELVSPRLKGAEVLALQELLRSTGYTDLDGRPLEPDGTFGPRTESALVRFATIYSAAPLPVVPHSVTINTKPFTIVIDGQEVDY